jgi:hypothetical protein
MVVESKPVTASLNVAVQLKTVVFVGLVAGTHENATVGDSRSTVQLRGKPVAVVALLPKVSVAPKVAERAADEVPNEFAPMELWIAIVQTKAVVWLDDVKLAKPSTKSDASKVEHVIGSLPVIVKVRAGLLVGVVLWPLPVRLGAVLSRVKVLATPVKVFPALSVAVAFTV